MQSLLFLQLQKLTFQLIVHSFYMAEGQGDWNWKKKQTTDQLFVGANAGQKSKTYSSSK